MNQQESSLNERIESVFVKCSYWNEYADAYIINQDKAANAIEALFNELQSKPTIQLEEGELGKVNMTAEQIEEFKKAMFNQPIQWQRSSERVFSLKDIEDAFQAGINWDCAEAYYLERGIKNEYPNKEQYLNSINKVKDGNE